MQCPAWIMNLKAGDEFFDSSKSFIGIVISNDNGVLFWIWKNFKTSRVVRSPSLGHEKLLDVAWIPASNLLKELL